QLLHPLTRRGGDDGRREVQARSRETGRGLARDLGAATLVGEVRPRDDEESVTDAERLHRGEVLAALLLPALVRRDDEDHRARVDWPWSTRLAGASPLLMARAPRARRAPHARPSRRPRPAPVARTAGRAGLDRRRPGPGPPACRRAGPAAEPPRPPAPRRPTR